MKNLFFILAFLSLSFTLVSCDVEDSTNDFYNVNTNRSTLRDVFRNLITQNNLKFKSEKFLEEDDAREILKPIIHETLSVLLNEGISKSEIIDQFGNLKSPEIAIVGIVLLAEDVSATKSNSYASKEQSVLDCAARAFVGMELHEGFWSSFTNRRTLLRAVGKLASRTLGFIGAALIVYDFADCMWSE